MLWLYCMSETRVKKSSVPPFNLILRKKNSEPVYKFQRYFFFIEKEIDGDRQMDRCKKKKILASLNVKEP